MNVVCRIFLGVLLSILVSGIINKVNGNEILGALLSLIALFGWIFFGFPKSKPKTIQTSVVNKVDIPNPNGANFVLDGIHDTLEIFDTKLTITPKAGATAILVRGLKGTKSIPYSSITAVQFRKANPINGYIQFSILGGKESGGGVIDAISDENSCFFSQHNNDLAEQIKNYIEEKMARPSIATPAAAKSIGEELSHLSELNKNGVLTDEEFIAAKEKLLRA